MPEQRTEHQQAADDLVKHVLQRAEAGGLAVSTEVRRATVDLAQRLQRETASPREFLAKFMNAFPAILRRYEPVLAQTLTDSTIASWLKGGQGIAVSVLPVSVPNPSAWILQEPRAEAFKPIVRFPIIEEAARDLAGRDLFNREAFSALESVAREEGALAGRVAALDAYERVRDGLIDAVVEGDAFETLEDKVGATLDRSGMSKPRQEMLFRNVVFRSYSRGQKAVAESEPVRSVAVFAWRANIDDSRCTHLCRALSNGGYQGMGIYLVDSVVWRKVAPQSHFGCRCGVVFLSVKRAAQKGVKVAQQWLQQGYRPTDAELYLPMPDLTGVPATEVAQFMAWTSPWQTP